jgi:hypothetical protein
MNSFLARENSMARERQGGAAAGLQRFLGYVARNKLIC